MFSFRLAMIQTEPTMNTPNANARTLFVRCCQVVMCRKKTG